MPDQPLMSLGLFVFSMATLPYTEMQRRTAARHAETERHGARPATQFLGPGEDTVTLSGSLVPGLSSNGAGGDYGSLNRVREMQASGDAWPLLDGVGTQLGMFKIMNVDERQTGHVPGGLARMVEFALDLKRVD